MLRISNIILSVVMIIVTTGFSVSRHFCHDRLVNTELFTLAPPSCHEIPESCCDGKETSHCSEDVEKDDCCKNENALVKFTEEFTVNQKYNPVVQQFVMFSTILPDFYKSIAFIADTGFNNFRTAQPPPAGANLLTLIQSFLI